MKHLHLFICLAVFCISSDTFGQASIGVAFPYAYSYQVYSDYYPDAANPTFGYDHLNYIFSIKNNGDQPLTNIYLTTVANADYSITFPEGPVAQLLPGQEITLHGREYNFDMYACFVSRQIQVHATRPDNTEITDLSGVDYYGDYETPVEVNSENPYVQADTAYHDGNANGIVDVGDSVDYNFWVNSNNFGPAPPPVVLLGLSDSPDIVTEPVYAYNFQILDYVYYLTQQDVDSGFLHYNLSATTTQGCNYYEVQVYDPTPCTDCPVPADCYQCITTKLGNFEPNVISGYVKFDLNGGNCANGTGFSKRKVSAAGALNTYQSFSEDNGHYHINVPADTYHLTANQTLNNNFNVSPVSYDIAASGSDMPFEANNFCVSSASGLTDLVVTLVPIDHPKPGFQTTYRIYYENRGSTALTGSLALAYDGTKLTYADSTVLPASAVSNTVTWNYSNLLPFQYGYIYVVFDVQQPPVANNGDVLNFTLSGTPVTADATPDDNVFTLHQNVVSSFDPNDKTVLEGAYIQSSQANDYLHYMTRFQNTGTAEATTVVIHENLDANLDWNTFEPVASSHNCDVQVTNGNKLVYTFPQIALPDSTSNEPQSHGWMLYKIKLKPGFTATDVATSSSSIYFDFNPPVQTNPVTTQFSALSINSIDKNSVRIFPNPAKDFLNVENTSSNTIDSFQVTDINGRIVLSGKFTSTVNVSALRSGVYFIRLQNSAGNVVNRFIKE